MITADARSQFTHQDVDLVVGCLTARLGGTEAANNHLARMGLDAVLDEPGLATWVLTTPIPGPSLSLLFYVLVRQSLIAEGIAERTLADYFATMLREFAKKGRANRPATHDDADHHYLVDIAADLERSSGPRAFRLAVHLGNYAIWLSGIYPDRVTARQRRRGAPGMAYYDALGRHGFAEASSHRLAFSTGLAGLLEQAADQYAGIRRALNQVGYRLSFRTAAL